MYQQQGGIAGASCDFSSALPNLICRIAAVYLHILQIPPRLFIYLEITLATKTSQEHQPPSTL